MGIKDIFKRLKGRSLRQPLQQILNYRSIVVLDYTEEKETIKKKLDKIMENHNMLIEVTYLDYHSFKRICLNLPKNLSEVGLSGFNPETTLSTIQTEVDDILNQFTEHRYSLLTTSNCSIQCLENRNYVFAKFCDNSYWRPDLVHIENFESLVKDILEYIKLPRG